MPTVELQRRNHYPWRRYGDSQRAPKPGGPFMLLALDIGNTSVHLGLFEGEKLLSTWRIGVEREKAADEYGVLLLSLLASAGYDRADVHACIIGCDVPPLTPTFEQVSQRYFDLEPLVVGHGLRTGVRILYDNPKQLGVDRIVDAVAAVHAYGAPVIVVDFGTATVFDAINHKGEYLGGALAPGIGIASEELFSRAAMLYRVQLETPPSAIGKNTVHAMQSGILLGYVGLVDGLVRRFKKELEGDPQVIATGGWAHQIAPESETIDVVDQGLTLSGLRLIYDMNND